MAESPDEPRIPIYPALLERLEGEVIVRFPNFPEVLTGAGTEPEALSLAADALEEAVLARLANGESVPLSPQVIAPGYVGVALPLLAAARDRGAHIRTAEG